MSTLEYAGARSISLFGEEDWDVGSKCFFAFNTDAIDASLLFEALMDRLHHI
jgi:hypothetical protein